jgi:hypothetical protein
MIPQLPRRCRPLLPALNRGLMFRDRVPDINRPQETVPLIASMSQPAYGQSWWPCPTARCCSPSA